MFQKGCGNTDMPRNRSKRPTNMDSLFPDSEVRMDSPRLKWLREHNCITFLSVVEPKCWFAGFADKLTEGEGPVVDWFFHEMGANGSSRCGEGETENEAIADLATKSSTPLWNETP